MSKPSTASALARQIPTKDLEQVTAALEREIRRIRHSRLIGEEEKNKVLPGLIDVWQIYKNALEHEATILLLCSIR